MVSGVIVLLVVAGFTGFVIAWRGRRIDDHPLCRRCGFDLTGRPEGNIVCGECGADLTAAKAIRIGHRRAAGGWLEISLIVLLIGSAGGGLDGVRVTQDTTWIQWMPVKYLLWKAQGSDPAAGKQALTELHRRATSSLLSGRQWASMIDVGLTCQGDRSLTWDPIWGDLIELGGSKDVWMIRDGLDMSPRGWPAYSHCGQGRRFASVIHCPFGLIRGAVELPRSATCK